MTRHEHPGTTRSWYREPLLWLAIAVPAATVVAGFVTLFLAARGSDEVVRDDFRKEGLAIYADPARDAAAARAGARARLTFDSTGERLRAQLSLQDGPLPDSLLVVLSHATRAEYDRLITLRGGNGSYEGRLEPLGSGHWYVEITPPGRQWRLKGDFRDMPPELTLAAAGVS
jgi:hypothetical protein